MIESEPVPPLTHAIVLVSAILLTASVVFQVYRRQVIGSIPSLAWLFLAVAPLAIRIITSSGPTPQEQATGAFAIAVSLVLSDYITRQASFPQHRAKSTNRLYRPLVAVLGTAVIGLPLLSIWLASAIPVLDVFTDSANAFDAREEFSKLLDVPHWLKVVIGWVPTVFGPLLIGILWLRRRFLASLSVFGWVALASILASAVYPLVAFVAITSVALASIESWKWQRLLFSLSALSLIATIPLSLVWISSNSEPSRSCEVDETKIIFVADIDRACRPPTPSLLRNVDGVTYRLALTPMEVSYWWYRHFEDPDLRRDLGNVVLRAEDPHAANVIGQRIYRERFPQRYKQSVSAYASVDADAYSIGGIPGVWIAGVMIFGLRLILALTTARNQPLDRLLFAMGNAMLAVFLFTASLQAILLAQGLALVLLLAGVNRLLEKPKSNQP